jgi:hypothetical protein
LECGSVLPLWEYRKSGCSFLITASSAKESGGAPPHSKRRSTSAISGRRSARRWKASDQSISYLSADSVPSIPANLVAFQLGCDLRIFLAPTIIGIILPLPPQ